MDKQIVWPICIVSILLFVLLKILYPHAIIAVDSYSYVRAAIQNSGIYTFPIGYSKVLAFFHLFTQSDWPVVCFQFLFLEGAILYFYFTVTHFLRPGKWISGVILGCLLVNPFVICISNYIMSDSIFTALTVIWFTVSLWYINKPRAILVYIMVLLVPLLFTIRYYAIFYPIITIPIILFSRIGWSVKLRGLVLGCLLFWGFTRYTGTQYEKLIGKREFSPFSGWQMASNAIVMYSHMKDRIPDVLPPEIQPLHYVVSRQVDSILAAPSPPDKNFYMWDKASPLRMYMEQQFRDHPGAVEFYKWASMGSLYGEYGTYLIRKHPIAYMRYYVLQGIEWFAMPEVDFHSVFLAGGFAIDEDMKGWFGYRSKWLPCSRSKIFALWYFPIIVLVLNLLMIAGTIGYFVLGRYKTVNPAFNKSVLLAAAYWVINFLFIIILAPMVLRYAIPIMIFNIAFGLCLVEHIYRDERDEGRVYLTKDQGP